MQRFWALLGAMATVLVLMVVVPAPAGARGVNVPDHGGGTAQVKRRPLTVVKHDSRIPTYDYYVLTFDRRATYEIGHKSKLGGGVGVLVALVRKVPQVRAAAMIVSGLFGLLASVADGAEHDGKCLALRVYVQRRKLLLNPPGPDVLLTKVYGTRKNCRGSYGHG